MHLPILALFTSTFGRLGGLLGLGMDRVQGKIPKDVPDLTAVDIVLQNLRERLTDVSSAVRSLEI
jgi:hypothetical protein